MYPVNFICYNMTNFLVKIPKVKNMVTQICLVTSGGTLSVNAHAEKNYFHLKTGYLPSSTDYASESAPQKSISRLRGQSKSYNIISEENKRRRHIALCRTNI